MTTTTTPAPRIRGGARDDDGTMMRLPEAALPCRSCGAAVRHAKPERAEVLRVHLTVAASVLDRMTGPVPSEEVPVTTCDKCADRRERAAAILAEHPRVRRMHGMVALDRLDAALAALDLLGWRGWRGTRMVRTLTSTDEALHDLLAALATLGSAASWAAGYAREGVAAATRWGHVPDALRRDAAAAHRSLVHRRFESPAPVPPPTDGARGCLLCGRDALTIRPSDRAEAWGERLQVRPASLGGSGRREPVDGYACPACWPAIRAQGGVLGLPAATAALFAFLDYERVGFGAHLREGIATPWVALRPDTPPNREPWAHLDLDRLRRSLDASPLVRRKAKPGARA